MNEFLQLIKDNYTPEEYLSVEYALKYAAEAHKTQKRLTGEPYIMHPINVATIVVDLGMDVDTVIAALLHDVVEDTPVTDEEIKQKFGSSIADMVEGVTKLSNVNVPDGAAAQESEQAENIRKLFIAMAKDIRVLIVKLADRLHNMSTMDALPREKQIMKSRETLDIYAPIAGRLGISEIKTKLEDYSMKYLYPDAYNYIQSKLNLQQNERIKVVEQLCSEISTELDELHFHYEIKGRPKHIYSIYKKMKSQNKSLDEIYDIVAIRIIVDTVKDCYTILGVIHSKWTPMPGRFKDYIASPKPNMYQSLHTTIITHYGQIFEIQIRTFEMNQVAEYGIAAHWKYKEGRMGKDMNELDAKFSWIRELMDIEGDLKDSKDFLDALKTNVNSTEIYVFTTKGMVVNLPVGSTPIDFAYRIHSEVGNKCVGVHINNKIAHLNTPLHNGDVVEILTSNNSKGPSRDWLNYAISPTAKKKIKAFFKKSLKEENIKLGKDMLEKEAIKKGYKLSDLMIPSSMKIINDKYMFSDIDDMYASIGCGGLRVSQIIYKLIDFYKKMIAETTPVEEVSQTRAPIKHTSGINIDGYDDFVIHLARCCNPVPGDPIIGYITRGRGVMVHRLSCPNVNNFEKERLISASWNKAVGSVFNAPLIIETENDGTVLSKIANIVLKKGMQISYLNAQMSKNRDKMTINLTIELHNTGDLTDIIKKISTEKAVISVNRIN